jgi:glycosyltransferase involved in cell wall biosynthesis
VFVLASRNDPSPLVIPEAREAGCAIVATAVGGIPESLDGGCAGMLVPPREPESLAEAIGTLLTDPAERARLKRRSAKNLAWLHLDRAVGETLAIYAEILGTTADFVTSASSHA